MKTEIKLTKDQYYKTILEYLLFSIENEEDQSFQFKSSFSIAIKMIYDLVENKPFSYYENNQLEYYLKLNDLHSYETKVMEQ